MVVRKRPNPADQENKINEIIQKGGSTANKPDKEKEPYRLTLRIPVALKSQVDDLIARDPVEPSLTAWILESIKQRVHREKTVREPKLTG